MSNMPTIGPPSSQSPREKEPVTNAQAIRALGFIILFGTLGLPLTILLWKVALTWAP